MENGDVAISFTLTQEEYRAGFHRQLRSAPVSLVPILGVFCVVIGVVYRDSLILLLGVSCFVFLALLVGLAPLMKTTLTSEVQHMAFNPQGVYLAERASETRSDWSLFKKVDEAPDFFLLKFRATNRAMVVPKRAFDSPGEVDYFREVANSALTNG